MAKLQLFCLPSETQPAIKIKITRHFKMQKLEFEETEKTSEPDSNITGILKLSDQEFKTTIINKLRL